MSIHEDVELLRRIPMFAKVDPAKLKLLAFTSERVTFDEGQELFHQGDAADAAYIVVDGSTEVIVDSPRGPLVVASLGKNALIGDIGILCDVPRTATIKALSRVTTEDRQGLVPADGHRFSHHGPRGDARTRPPVGEDDGRSSRSPLPHPSVAPAS